MRMRIRKKNEHIRFAQRFIMHYCELYVCWSEVVISVFRII